MLHGAWMGWAGLGWADTDVQVLYIRKAWYARQNILEREKAVSLAVHRPADTRQEKTGLHARLRPSMLAMADVPSFFICHGFFFPPFFFLFLFLPPSF